MTQLIKAKVTWISPATGEGKEGDITFSKTHYCPDGENIDLVAARLAVSLLGPTAKVSDITEEEL